MNILLVLIGILLFEILIISHEWGHFITAKTFGVKVNEFALGMGPKIFSIQKGETNFSIRLFPFGGFCAMEGEDEASGNPRAFNNIKPWKRMIVLAAGATMNLIVGFIFTLIIMAQSSGFVSNTVSGFAENATSQACGLQAGDEILKVNGMRVFTSKDISFAILTSEKNSFDFKVKRNGEKTELKNIEFEKVEKENGTKALKIDFKLDKIPKSFFTVIKEAFLDMISTIQITWLSFIGIITGKFSLKEVTGPVGMVSMIGTATSKGLEVSLLAGINNMISVVALIALNLGIMNLLPFPALDGGRIVFALFEQLTGKKISEKYEGIIHTIGFILLIGLIIFITFNDIMGLFKRG